MPTMSEEELFSDPRASLDRISGAPPPGPRVESPSAPLQGFGDVGPISDDSYRDPFRPLGSDKATQSAASIDRSAPAGAPQEEAGTTTAQSPPDAKPATPAETRPDAAGNSAATPGEA